LLLLNTAPVSHADYLLFQHDRLTRAATDMEMLQAGSSDSSYQEGDPDTMTRYYRIHFRTALRQPEHLEQIIQSLRSSFTKEGILKARKIEERLIDETWLSSGYNLLPHLKRLNIPTLIMHGDHDFIPVECATHIAQVIPGARFVLLKECGHFSYLECPEGVRQAIDNFFHATRGLPGGQSL
jgi:proline iminopeptidase